MRVAAPRGEAAGGGRPVRRLLVGRGTRAALAVLIGGSLLLAGVFVPTYLAILVASGLRNAWGLPLGDGPAFLVAVCGLLYAQAVLLSTLYHLARYLVRTVTARGPWSV